MNFLAFVLGIAITFVSAFRLYSDYKKFGEYDKGWEWWSLLLGIGIAWIMIPIGIFLTSL